MWVWSLSGEDPLEEGMAIHSSILAWRIPRAEELSTYTHKSHGGRCYVYILFFFIKSYQILEMHEFWPILSIYITKILYIILYMYCVCICVYL